MSYPDTDDYTARVMRAAQVLKEKDAVYFAPVIRALLSGEQKARRKPTARKKRVDVARHGVRVRGGRAYLELSPDVEIVGEMPF
jgi:hypothetical protein